MPLKLCNPLWTSEKFHFYRLTLKIIIWHNNQAMTHYYTFDALYQRIKNQLKKTRQKNQKKRNHWQCWKGSVWVGRDEYLKEFVICIIIKYKFSWKQQVNFHGGNVKNTWNPFTENLWGIAQILLVRDVRNISYRVMKRKERDWRRCHVRILPYICQTFSDLPVLSCRLWTRQNFCLWKPNHTSVTGS